MRPPRFAAALLRAVLHRDDRAVALADVQEEFDERAARDGVRAARQWYRAQAWRSIGPALRRRLGHGPRRFSRFGGLRADLRLSARMLIRQPLSTIAIAATLALGIGATTAIYAVFNYVLFRPIPGVTGDASLISVVFQPPNSPRTYASGASSALSAMRHAGADAGLEHLSYGEGGPLSVAVPSEQPTFETGQFVTSQFFATLGVRARSGRLFTDDEADSGGSNIVIISEHLWRAKFGGAPTTVGTTISVNGHPFVIAGIADGFRGWGSTRVGMTDLWLPIGTERVTTGYAPTSMTTLVGRLSEEGQPEIVQQALRTAYAGVVTPRSARDAVYVPVVSRGLYPSNRGNPAGLRLYWLMMAAVGLLLLLSCANAANLLLARASRRERDTAVRLAIGAGRWRVVRQFLIESLGLATIAGALGLGAGYVLMMSFRGMRLLWTFPELDTLELDGRVVTFAVGVTAGTVLAFGLLPALIASRADIRGVLGRAGRGVAAPHRLRNSLMVVQIALSLTLLVGAGVFNRSLQNLFATNLGADVNHVIDLSLKPYNIGYNDAKSSQLIATTMDALQRSGFTEVSISFPEPLSMSGGSVRVRTDTMAALTRTDAMDSQVSPTFFSVLRIPMLAGRTFTDAEYGADASVNPMPVILNATLARNLFQQEVAVGKTFDLERSIGPQKIESTALIVGIAGDTRSTAVRDVPQPMLYIARQSTWRFGHILVKSNGPDAAAMERIRSVVRAVDPALPITALRPLADSVVASLSEDRVLARLSAIVALLAALLAATGVAAVISQLVIERTRDFGIRSALGASRGDIVGHVLHGVLARSVLGVVLGFGLYWGCSRWVQARLYKLDVLDPVTVAAATIGLVLIALLAAFVPARRAANIDPMTALRAE